jgi:hypothetical protein
VVTRGASGLMAMQEPGNDGLCGIVASGHVTLSAFLRHVTALKKCHVPLIYQTNVQPVTPAPSDSQRLRENVRCRRYPRHSAWSDCRSPISTGGATGGEMGRFEYASCRLPDALERVAVAWSVPVSSR